MSVRIIVITDVLLMTIMLLFLFVPHKPVVDVLIAGIATVATFYSVVKVAQAKP